MYKRGGDIKTFICTQINSFILRAELKAFFESKRI